jgi:hypothetical protein
MAEVWTRKSANAFATTHIPLSAASSGPIDIAFALPSEWQEVLQYTDGSLKGLVAELARRESTIPEPGVEVGPDDSVWQVELAWPAKKVAVVIDDEPEREAWLAADGWTVTHIERTSKVEALADILSDQVGGVQ